MLWLDWKYDEIYTILTKNVANFFFLFLKSNKNHLKPSDNADIIIHRRQTVSFLEYS